MTLCNLVVTNTSEEPITSLPEAGSEKFLQKLVTTYNTTQRHNPDRPQFTFSLPSKPQISYNLKNYILNYNRINNLVHKEDDNDNYLVTEPKLQHY